MAGAKPQKLEDQAATAALYVTRSQREDHSKSQYPLNEDNKLSSAGAAASLKYASPRDLPSYPISGLANMDSSAGAAANLANANQKPFEHWKPDPSASASKAALAAKDYKPAAVWHPGTSAAGSKAAALATKDRGHVNVWRPEATEAGNSAAGQAMRAKGLSPQLDYGYTTDGSKRALLAATGAMAGSRKRSGSTPIARNLYPDSENSVANALSAATIANKPAKGVVQPRTDSPSDSSSPRIDAARIHNAALINLSREMFTSHPPVAPEVNEKNRQDGLRAAAVSMAKQMYDVQQKAIEQARESDRSDRSDSQSAATFLHNRRPSISSTDEPLQSPPQYVNLQEAAQKLAAERLAKLHDEHSAYRNYYGASAAPQSRLSIRNRPRRRASSDGHIDESDENRSKQIRSEMSLFNQKITQVDAKKRQNDRESLMAAAQRNVKASLHGIDERVYAETGKASPAMMSDWEAKANARAKADSDARMVNHGRVDIGGGKYLSQSEIDAIAARRVQPTLDEITKKAENQRARDEQLQLEERERNELAAAKTADDKERAMKTKEEWKRFKEDEKQEARAKKEEEKARKAEEKRLREEEKRKSKGVLTNHDAVLEKPAAMSDPPATGFVSTVEPTSIEEPGHPSISSQRPPSGEVSAYEPSISNIASAEPNNIEAVPIDQHGQSENIAMEEKGFDASSKKDTLSDEPVSPDEGALGKETGKASRTGQSLQRTVSTVDPALLDPALREPAIEDEANPEVGSVVVNDPETLNSPSNAELTAMRVLSAPIETDPPTSIPKGKPSNTAEKKDSETDTKLPKIVNPEEPATALAQPTKHRDPLETRIAPPITETTISGPSSTPKSPKGESKVSSWLKTKFSRRASKPARPEISDPIKSSSSNFIASGAPVAPAASSESKIRDEPLTNDVAVPEQEGVNPAEGTPSVREPSNAHKRGNPKHGSNSSSSISLSSDEDTRGRTDLRREKSPSSRGDDFEEARDHFDTEKLEPPAALGNFGRGSDSPVRDSRFQEDL